MGLRERLGAADGIRDVFASLRENNDRPASVERFLVTLVASVRDDERAEERGRRDVYVAARKRRRRLGLIAFGAGPLVGVANQLADLYCEIAVFCEVAALHGVKLDDEEVGAHMLMLWGVVDDHDAARGAMAGEPPIATILTELLHDRAGEHLPETLSKSAIVKALWDARTTLGGARKGATTGAVRTVAFTGHRTKKVIKGAEAQLGVGRQ